MSNQDVSTLAELADKDVSEAVKLGSKISSTITAQLLGPALTLRMPDVDRIMKRVLLPELRDGMLVSYLKGYKRAVTSRPTAMGLFDPILAVLKQKTPINLKTIAERFQTRAFEIVRKASKQIKTRLQSTVDTLIKEGTNRSQAIKVIRATFDSLGLTPAKNHQIEAIFRTQAQSAFSAGRWIANEEVKDILWGYRYSTVGDDRVRPAHEILEGVTLPADDEFWETMFPPNGWNCRCQAIELFEERDIVEAPSGYEADPGFGFNPGMAFTSLMKLSFDEEDDEILDKIWDQV